MLGIVRDLVNELDQSMPEFAVYLGFYSARRLWDRLLDSTTRTRSRHCQGGDARSPLARRCRTRLRRDQSRKPRERSSWWCRRGIAKGASRTERHCYSTQALEEKGEWGRNMCCNSSKQLYKDIEKPRTSANHHGNTAMSTEVHRTFCYLSIQGIVRTQLSHLGVSWVRDAATKCWRFSKSG
jgi:hypothetical protein